MPIERIRMVLLRSNGDDYARHSEDLTTEKRRQ
jgi:hypothetical protein